VDTPCGPRQFEVSTIRHALRIPHDPREAVGALLAQALDHQRQAEGAGDLEVDALDAQRPQALQGEAQARHVEFLAEHLGLRLRQQQVARVVLAERCEEQAASPDSSLRIGRESGLCWQLNSQTKILVAKLDAARRCDTRSGLPFGKINWTKALSTPLRSSLFLLAKATGRYKDWSRRERSTCQTDTVYFEGDIPPTAGKERNQRRLVLSEPPPLATYASKVLYTSAGMAWVRGRLERRYSFQEVGVRHLVDKPRQPARVVARGSVLQSQTPWTYGDWMSEHVTVLAQALCAGLIVEPLLLPERWFVKPYVKRDLAVLGIRAESVEVPVLIEDATVINKQRHSHFWTRTEVGAVMAGMSIVQRPCEPGSALYLSRQGQRAEGSQRSVDNSVTEAAMEHCGIKIVRTSGLGPDDYIRFAPHAETVYFDHGSAGDNLMHWQTRRVVEFFRPSPNYWDPSFLFLSDCLGIHDYHLWEIRPDTTVVELVGRIDALRSRPLEGV
jgi:hypothetical protein